jgi:hypothetical protein
LCSSPFPRALIFLYCSCQNFPSTVAMTQIDAPDPDEHGGNVTKPFKFVTGMEGCKLRDLLRLF